MAKRCLDLLLAALALTALSPVLAWAAIGIKLCSSGPILYRARRSGLLGGEFVMLKFRSMEVAQEPSASVITAQGDRRVFPFGRLLRKLKVDELPQLWNVLMGEMSLIGPRPEAVPIVQRYYTALGRETLTARPGLASPGSIYNYTHGEQMLTGGDTESAYLHRLMPVKLALDVVYVRRASFSYDLRLIGRTVWVIFCLALGRRRFPDPPEMAEARHLLESFAPSL